MQPPKLMLVLFLVICATVLAVSFVCSLTEAVLLSLNPLLLKVRQQEGRTHAARWLAFKNQIERPISAILVFSTIANTGLATLAGALFQDVFGVTWLWLFTVVLTFTILFGTEMVPKLIGVHHAERLAPHLVFPLTWMLRICHPVVLLMGAFSKRIISTGIHSQNGSGSSQIMDIITLTQAAHSENVLHNREEIIIIHAATLSARRVRNSMVPREAVKVFHKGRSLLENVRKLGPKLHRSYPVSEDGTMNRVVGYIRIRELFQQNILSSEASDWTSQIRPVLPVGGGVTLTHLLALLLEEQDIAALVEDIQGNSIGWVTMDDVMKVLMGARV